jgi:hypothetical protein
MSAKEQLLNEIEDAPNAMVEEILDFCLFLKQSQIQTPKCHGSWVFASLLKGDEENPKI